MDTGFTEPDPIRVVDDRGGTRSCSLSTCLGDDRTARSERDSLCVPNTGLRECFGGPPKFLLTLRRTQVDYLSATTFGDSKNPAVTEVLETKTLAEAADCLRSFAVDLVGAAARSRSLLRALEGGPQDGCCRPPRSSKKRGAK